MFPGQFMGLSGLGEFSLDLYDLFGDSRFLQGAEKAARGIMLFRVERNGIAFPGDQLARLSCDYGTGAQGSPCFSIALLVGSLGISCLAWAQRAYSVLSSSEA